MTLIVALAACGLCCAGLLIGRSEVASRSSLYGDARFAKAGEVAQSGLFDPQGILIGRAFGRYLRFPGQQFVLVSAPTRSGKGVGIVIPNLLTFNGSVVVLDIKGENFQHTAAYRAAHGQAVFRFNPFSADSTHFNPLDVLSPNEDQRFGEVMAMATSIYPPSRDNPFWNEQAANLFVGLVLYLCETPELARTFTQLISVLHTTGAGDARRATTRMVQTREASGRPLSQACSGALLRFSGNSEAAAAGIVSSFHAPLLVFANPLVARATATSDFALADVRSKPMSIYLTIDPQHLKAARVILNVFFTQLIFQNTRALEGKAAGDTVCLLLMDEFTSIGRIDILAHSIAFMAGYNLRLITIVQSIAQLVGVYGENDARTLLANHALRVIFAPSELRDAREISEMLGMTTYRSTLRSASQSGLGMRRSITTRRHEQPRALLLPQELRTLGPDRQIVLLDGHAPILAKKIRYFEDKELRLRARASRAASRAAHP